MFKEITEMEGKNGVVLDRVSIDDKDSVMSVRIRSGGQKGTGSMLFQVVLPVQLLLSLRQAEEIEKKFIEMISPIVNEYARK